MNHLLRSDFKDVEAIRIANLVVESARAMQDAWAKATNSSNLSIRAWALEMKPFVWADAGGGSGGGSMFVPPANLLTPGGAP